MQAKSDRDASRLTLRGNLVHLNRISKEKPPTGYVFCRLQHLTARFPNGPLPKSQEMDLVIRSS